MADFDIDAYLAKDKKKTGFDIDAYLKKTAPETALQTFGRSTASMADSALNAITGTLDAAAYPLARAFGRSPEQAQAESTSPKDVFGRAFGVAGTAGYENAPLRQVGTYIGEGLNENVIQPLAQTTGLPEQDIGNMVGTGMLAAGAVAPKVVKPVYNAGKTAAVAGGNVAKGALGTGFNYIARPGVEPKGYQIPSARAKLGNDFIEPKSYEAYQQGKIPIEEMGNYPNTKPIAELPQNALERTALQLGGGTMPFKGQAAQAFGERLGETYRNPVTAAIDIGTAMYSGVPVYTAGKTALGGVRAAGDYLMSKKGFDPMLPETLKFAREAQQTIEGLGGVSGPVSPGGMAMATPAATAAMATTQRVSQPRTPAQPKPSGILPDAGTHYTAAQQELGPDASLKAIFDRAVYLRAVDLAKQAKANKNKYGMKQYVVMDNAFDDIKEWRRENIPEFKEKPVAVEPETTGPVAPTVTNKEFIDQIKPPKPDYELVSDQGIWKRLQDKTAADIPLEVNEQTAVRRITNKYGQNPFQTGDLKGNSVLEAPKTEAPKVKLTAEELVDKQKWKALQNLNDYDKHTAGQKAEIDRITKKYGDEPFGLGDITGQTTDPNATFTPYAPDVQSSLKDVTMGTKNPDAGMRRSRTESAVYKIGKNTTVEKSAYDEVATQFGLKPINWDNMPNVQGMPIKEARKEIRQFVAAQFRPQYEKRVQRSKMMDVQKSMMTPEELAADQAETIALAAKAEERMKKLVGNKSSSSKPTTPKVETPKPTTPEVAGPVRPEGAVDTPKMTTNELLELIRARGKNKAPPGTMSMMTNEPSDFMKDLMLSELKGTYNDMPVGTFEQNGIRHEIIDNESYTRMPESVRKKLPDTPKKIYRQIDVKTGKVLQGQKSLADLQAEAADLLKKAQEGKKKQGK